MLNNKLASYRVILGSTSPRRQQLLRDLRLEFSIEKRDVEERYPKYLHGSEITDYLSELKAAAFEGHLKEGELLITADTIVRFQGKVLGKPKDKHEAKHMLEALSGQVHEVISSISLTTLEKQVTFHDTTRVFFKELSEEEIGFYIEEYQPFDKAGAYGIQEWLGYIAVEKLEGSYFNVMGFPVHKFYKEILKF